MAIAVLNPGVTKTEIVEIEPETVTLTLSRYEAEVIRFICARIGSASKARRVFSDTDQSIDIVLANAGIRKSRKVLLDSEHGSGLYLIDVEQDEDF